MLFPLRHQPFFLNRCAARDSTKNRFCRLAPRRSKLHIACSDFFKSQSALIALLLLSKSNPLRWASIWFWAQSRKKIDFNSLLQKERHALRVSLFGSCLLPQAKGGLWGGPAGILRERLRGHPLPMHFRWFHRTSPLKRQGRKRRLRSREQPSHGDFPQGGCFVMLRQKRGRGTDRRAAGLPGSLIWRR